MIDDKKTLKMAHNLILEERKKLTVSGVMDVDSFDEETVVAFTDLGELTIKGSNLHINKINVESGDLAVEGLIHSISYSEERKTTGFFSKLFK